MITFVVQDKISKKVIGKFSDLELDELYKKNIIYDTRLYNIIPDYKFKEKPETVIKVFKGDKKGNYKEIFYPIYNNNYDNLILTLSGHFLLKDSLPTKDLINIEIKEEAEEIFGNLL